MSATVRGHTCAGLHRLEAAVTYGCVPELYDDGTMVGCDADNPIAFLFCPMCGDELPPITKKEDDNDD